MSKAKPSELLQIESPLEAQQWTQSWLRDVDARFGDRSARAVLEWGLHTFAPRIALATSFGPQTIVLMHWISQIAPSTTVFYLDTGLLFPQTYELRDRLQDRLGLQLVQVPASLSLERQAREHGGRLWTRKPDRCCELRKVLPLRRFLTGYHAWITGIRRAHGPSRSVTAAVEWDAKHGLVKLNPLASWSTRRVWAYLREHELPYNTLHDEGYPSLGCQPCTRAVRPGEHERAGRWDGSGKTECGIHGRNGAPRP